MNRNTYTIEAQHALTFDKLLRANKHTQSFTNRDIIDGLIDSARINANDTLIEDPSVPDEHWDMMFRGSLGTLLSSNTYDRHVLGFFEKNGIRW